MISKMKKTVAYIICFSVCLITLAGCGNVEGSDKTDTPDYECEIIESPDFVCEKPMKKGIYTDAKQWKNAVNDTDVTVVLEKENAYDEAFFNDYVLCYIADVFSGFAQYEYEGYVLEEIEGKRVMTISVSYSAYEVINSQHSYHFFLSLDREAVGTIDEIVVEKFCRD